MQPPLPDPSHPVSRPVTNCGHVILFKVKSYSRQRETRLGSDFIYPSCSELRFLRFNLLDFPHFRHSRGHEAGDSHFWICRHSFKTFLPLAPAYLTIVYDPLLSSSFLGFHSGEFSYFSSLLLPFAFCFSSTSLPTPSITFILLCSLSFYSPHSLFFDVVA